MPFTINHYNAGRSVETEERCPRCGSKHLWDFGSGVTGCRSCGNLITTAGKSFEELVAYHERLHEVGFVVNAVSKYMKR